MSFILNKWIFIRYSFLQYIVFFCNITNYVSYYLGVLSTL